MSYHRVDPSIREGFDEWVLHDIDREGPLMVWHERKSGILHGGTYCRKTEQHWMDPSPWGIVFKKRLDLLLVHQFVDENKLISIQSDVALDRALKGPKRWLYILERPSPTSEP